MSIDLSLKLTKPFFLLAGMTMFPHVDTAHGFDIAFNASDRSSWRRYAKTLEAHLKRKSCKFSDFALTLFNKEDAFSVERAQIQMAPAHC